MAAQEVSRIGLALASAIKERLGELRADEYPTEAVEVFARAVERITGAVGRVVEQAPEERVKQFACQILSSLAEDLRFISGASSSLVPAPLIPAIDSLVAGLFPDRTILLRVQATYNFEVFEVFENYKEMLSHLLEQTEIDQIFGSTRLLIISMPEIENASVLLQPTIGHELGHRIADQLLDNEDQTELLHSIEERIGDLRWANSRIGDLPELFQIPTRQHVFDTILQARRRALEELVSDLVGFQLFGPSALFSVEYIAATDTWDGVPSEDYDFYPPWRYRLRELLAFAGVPELTGAIARLEGEEPVPAIREAAIGRLRTLEAIAGEDTDKSAIEDDELLRRAYTDVEAALRNSRQHVSEALGPSAYGLESFVREVGRLLERLALGVPPDEVDGTTPDFRSAIAAGWLYRVSYLPLPFSADGTWTAECDRAINRLVEKAIESIELKRGFRRWTDTRR